MAKYVFTKTQSVSMLVQFQTRAEELDIHKYVDPTHKLFTESCEALEQKLKQYVNEEGFAAVVEDPIFLT